MTKPHPPTRRKRTTRGRPPLIEEGWDETAGTWLAATPAGRVIAAMRTGNYLKVAAEHAGLHRDTVAGWLARGREHTPEADHDRTKIDLAQRPYVDFLAVVTRAEATAEVELVALWRGAARDDYRAARDLLARRHPDRWVPREAHTIEATVDTGADLIGAALDDPALVLRLAEVAHEIEDAAGERSR